MRRVTPWGTPAAPAAGKQGPADDDDGSRISRTVNGASSVGSGRGSAPPDGGPRNGGASFALFSRSSSSNAMTSCSGAGSPGTNTDEV